MAKISGIKIKVIYDTNRSIAHRTMIFQYYIYRINTISLTYAVSVPEENQSVVCLTSKDKIKRY